jgi:hypothetical protein
MVPIPLREAALAREDHFLPRGDSIPIQIPAFEATARSPTAFSVSAQKRTPQLVARDTPVAVQVQRRKPRRLQTALVRGENAVAVPIQFAKAFLEALPTPHTSAFLGFDSIDGSVPIPVEDIEALQLRLHEFRAPQNAVVIGIDAIEQRRTKLVCSRGREAILGEDVRAEPRPLTENAHTRQKG